MAACKIAKLRVERMVAGSPPGVRTITKSVLFHSMTALTDWAEFWPSSGAVFAEGASRRKVQINTKVAKTLNVCLYLRLFFVRMPGLRPAYLRPARRLGAKSAIANCDDSVASLASLLSE